jgi:SAM-dependent methyltransferase
VGCAARYPIVRYVPRFVPDEGYVEGFGLQWNIHRRTQYDLTSGMTMSEGRFFEETGWPPRLEGEVIIEAGSGSGRFTEVALGTGALVLSLDFSHAVDANYASNGDNDKLLLVQGDLFHMPFEQGVADRLFCFGVLQHTPDPKRGFEGLAQYVRPGGAVVADIYAKTFVRYALATKYWIRPLTRRMPPALLYRLTTRYVDFMWPLARKIRQIPKLGRSLNWRLLIGDYSDVTADDDVLRDWARLDTFDMLSPRYDKPASFKTVKRWCSEVGLVSTEVLRKHVYVIRGRRPEPG